MKYAVATLLLLSGSIYSSFLIYIVTEKQIQEEKSWLVKINNQIDEISQARKEHREYMDCMEYYNFTQRGG